MDALAQLPVSDFLTYSGQKLGGCVGRLFMRSGIQLLFGARTWRHNSERQRLGTIRSAAFSSHADAQAAQAHEHEANHEPPHEPEEAEPDLAEATCELASAR